MPDKSGLLVTFEGPEGSGKTTQARLLFEGLKGKGRRVILTREPGGTDIGDQIRQVLLNPENTGMLPSAEILLFSAARAQLVNQAIRPKLEEGAIVLCDRFADSTMAYQGYGLGLDLEVLGAITEFATGGLLPDLTVYLDVPVEVGLRRKRRAFEEGGGTWDRLDRKEMAYHQRVRDGYLEMAAEEPGRWLVLDGTLPVEEIQKAVRHAVKARLRESTGTKGN